MVDLSVVFSAYKAMPLKMEFEGRTINVPPYLSLHLTIDCFQKGGVLYSIKTSMDMEELREVTGIETLKSQVLILGTSFKVDIPRLVAEGGVDEEGNLLVLEALDLPLEEGPSTDYLEFVRAKSSFYLSTLDEGLFIKESHVSWRNKDDTKMSWFIHCSSEYLFVPDEVPYKSREDIGAFNAQQLLQNRKRVPSTRLVQV